MNEISRRIKELREARHLTQDDLARLLNVSSSTISMYEVGSRFPKPELLEALADIFNVDIDYLIGRSERTTQILSEDEIMIVDKYRSASPEIRSAVKAVLGIRGGKNE